MINKLISVFSGSNKVSISPRPYINHSVEFKKSNTPEERMKTLEKVGLNVFFFPSEMITGCDFLSDSGTTTMTNEQWAALHLGDEAYGSNRGYFRLREQILKTFGNDFFNPPEKGKPNAFLFHQGRACENALFSIIGQMGTNLIIPSNGHFDTTQANIEANHITPINLFSLEFKNGDEKFRFKGNMDILALKKLIKEKYNSIPILYLTITNNTGGGQPVSLANIREVSEIAHHAKIPLFFDACRFAENAWFIRKYEKGYSQKSIRAIVLEMFSYIDGFTISFKKDGLVNMGGGLFIKNTGLFTKKYPHLIDAIMNFQIRTEGHPSYGGLSGRDIMTLTVGLKTVMTDEYLNYRINQVITFGEEMKNAGLPVQMPIGGHAVYLNVNKFYAGTKMRGEDFGGISLTALLLGLYGHRACELGYFAFGKYNPNTRKEIHPEVNFVRFAVPRLRYERQDLSAAIVAVKALHDKRDKIPPVKVVYGRDLPLRHFKARFQFLPKFH
ncbi:tryptophanase [Candidatus Gottesmanbacteria bacterium]|nr:tryptophanase [Candidatus Gottesmanbacteria bacterium]